MTHCNVSDSKQIQNKVLALVLSQKTEISLITNNLTQTWGFFFCSAWVMLDVWSSRAHASGIPWYEWSQPLAFMYQTTTTVTPPISKHPKCQAQVVAYGTWLLTRALTTLAPGFIPFFKNKFPGLFQDSSRTHWFFKGFKIHFGPYTPKISMLTLLTAFHTLHVF